VCLSPSSPSFVPATLANEKKNELKDQIETLLCKSHRPQSIVKFKSLRAPQTVQTKRSTSDPNWKLTWASPKKKKKKKIIKKITTKMRNKHNPKQTKNTNPTKRKSTTR
jgi:hypothetical protein